MQKKDHKNEQPIAFFNHTIRDVALRYNIIEKKALDLVKDLKDFRVYILHTHTISYVPTTAVKEILVQTNIEGKRRKWIAATLEYDLEIKPTNLIKGQGLAKLMDEYNLLALDINLIAALPEEEKEEDPYLQVFDMFLSSPWYSHIVYVLQHLNPPPEVPKAKSRSLKLKASKYSILDGVLYWKDLGGMLLNFLVENEAKDVMKYFHKGDCGGHHFWNTTTNKVLRASFYWSTFFLMYIK